MLEKEKELAEMLHRGFMSASGLGWSDITFPPLAASQVTCPTWGREESFSYIGAYRNGPVLLFIQQIFAERQVLCQLLELGG